MERKVSRVESFRTSLKNQKQRLMAQKQVCMMYYYFIIEIFKFLLTKLITLFLGSYRTALGNWELEENSKRKRRKRNQRYVIYTGYKYYLQVHYKLDKVSYCRATDGFRVGYGWAVGTCKLASDGFRVD